MLAYGIYYVDIITFVYKICLFCLHNAQVHSAFCLQNESPVLLPLQGNMCLLQYFVDTMQICVFFMDKRRYGVSWAIVGVLRIQFLIACIVPGTPGVTGKHWM